MYIWSTDWLADLFFFLLLFDFWRLRVNQISYFILALLWVASKCCCKGQSWTGKFWWEHLLRIPYVACLQPSCAVSPSAGWQLQHVRVEEAFASLESSCIGGCPHITNKGEVACNLSRHGQIFGSLTLHKAILFFIHLYIDWNVSYAWQSEHFLGFCIPHQGYQERQEFSAADRWLVNICLTVIMSKPRCTSRGAMR